ncbi:MAG: hypothetical protein E7485_08255 [Ruminococcaceae bacterium]|nr:hypothetical protein [Oscillospiraceae bacterium]
MAIVATYNFDGCICKIDDSYYANRTPEQQALDRKIFEDTASRLLLKQAMKDIERKREAAEKAKT